MRLRNLLFTVALLLLFFSSNAQRLSLGGKIAFNNTAVYNKNIFDQVDYVKTGANSYGAQVNVMFTRKWGITSDILLANNNLKPDNIIMNNFPLQKWVYVILSIDNNVADMYIDGKMVRSQKLASNSEPITKEASIIPGKMDAYLAKVEREPLPMDPTMAWNKYMEGNGGNYFSKMFSNYGATFTLKKDDLDVRQFNLF
jgi:hypothetical protein